ncbi:MAG: acireductone synthase [Bacteriovorax sp.]|jgi:enolase-phosphatase E1
MKYILMDVEGTTTSISFVHEVLFPYSAERVESFIMSQAEEEVIREILDQTKTTVLEEEHKSINEDEAIAKLISWIKTDRKHPALKKLQGMIWKTGYQAGELKGHVYQDVPEALENWKKAGLSMGIYSSGSVEAQRVLFGHSVCGDLNHYFDNNFDTSVGPKRDVKSYFNISSELNIDPKEILFLSDIGEELDAAKMAGFQTIQLVRQDDLPYREHKQVRNFLEIKI